MTGPLAGLKVIELAGLAPAPFATMILADLGAEVIRVDKTAPDPVAVPNDPLTRSRRRIGLDTRSPEGAEILLKLIESADVLIEGFRPGVMEKMGLGPDVALARNPRLIYGRMTGWGQTGALAPTAGHDINYIAISGALEPLGRAGQQPHPPINLLGDFGGGGLVLAMGVLAALHERSVSGHGQVIDSAMTDGSALLSSFIYGMRAAGAWPGGRGENMLDGGAPFYDTYRCADGKYVAIGAIEEKFYQQLIQILELTGPDVPQRWSPADWPKLRAVIAERVATKTRDEWAKLAEPTDACLSPVLTPEEAAQHQHNVDRGTFVELDGVLQPAPAPRFSRTPAGTPTAPVGHANDTTEVLLELGYTTEDISKLEATGTVK
ncbi:CoA transferase [Pseudonocardiaceae bacterium YIM PH 21723]|nr:CoA transferase [Pseudonocardiaceae bacterium YIM PH 21723]